MAGGFLFVQCATVTSRVLLAKQYAFLVGHINVAIVPINTPIYDLPPWAKERI